MPLDSSQLASEMRSLVEAKLTEAIDEEGNQYFTNLAQEFKDKFIGAWTEGIAEAVVEHIKTNAEVRVIIIGLDTGAALSPDVQARLIARGDLPLPYVPDLGLQQELPPSGTPVPTTAPLTSLGTLSVPGLID